MKIFKPHYLRPKYYQLGTLILLGTVLLLSVFWFAACLNSILTINLASGILLSFFTLPLCLLLIKKFWSSYKAKVNQSIVLSIGLEEEFIWIEYLTKKKKAKFARIQFCNLKVYYNIIIGFKGYSETYIELCDINSLKRYQVRMSYGLWKRKELDKFFDALLHYPIEGAFTVKKLQVGIEMKEQLTKVK